MIERNIGEVQQYLEQVASFVEDMVSDYGDLLEIISRESAINAAFSQQGTLPAEEEAGLYSTIYLLIAGKRIKPGLHVISEKGNLSLSTQPLPAEYNPLTYGNWGLIRRAKESAGKTVIYATGISNRIGSKATASIARLVRNPGAEDYFIIADLYKEHIGTIVNSLGSGKTVYLDITDSQLIPFYTAANEIPRERFDLYRRFIFYGEKLSDTYDLGGRTSILVHHKSDVLGMHFFGVQVLSDTLRGNVLGQRILFLIGLGTTFLCLFLAVLIAKNVSDPLYEIIRSVVRIKNGDLSHRIGLARKDEIGMLADSIDDMSSRIAALIENNKNKEQTLRLAELRALQAQIHPHFIFNCLDLIKWNARMGKGEEVSSIVLELGRFLRGIIRNTKEIVPLEHEIQIIRDYLTIQKRRFDERLQFDLSVDPDIVKIPVPKFILQPIVENSLVHGIEEKTGAGHIDIRAFRTGDYLEYEIQDDGIGINEETLEKIRSGGLSDDQIGLMNVRRRLGLYYGSNFSFVVEAGINGGSRVYIRTPVFIQEPG